MVRLPRNEKQAYWWNSGPQMWPFGLTLTLTLTLNFQGQTWNLLYLSQKWSDCHDTKKNIDWTQDLKSDHGVWPWPWPWHWIFKVKYGICYISTKNGPIATKRKGNIWIELKTSNVTMVFDLGHDLDVEFSRSNMEFAISQSNVIWRSGVRICKIVTGVTSDVGVRSTHLVFSGIVYVVLFKLWITLDTICKSVA